MSSSIQFELASPWPVDSLVLEHFSVLSTDVLNSYLDQNTGSVTTPFIKLLFGYVQFISQCLFVSLSTLVNGSSALFNDIY